MKNGLWLDNTGLVSSMCFGQLLTYNVSVKENIHASGSKKGLDFPEWICQNFRGDECASAKKTKSKSYED